LLRWIDVWATGTTTRGENGDHGEGDHQFDQRKTVPGVLQAAAWAVWARGRKVMGGVIDQGLMVRVCGAGGRR
jgi:hypothetical protein